MNEEFKNLEDMLRKSDEEVKKAFTQFEGQVKENGDATAKVRDELKSQAERNDEIAQQMSKLKDDVTGILQKGTKLEEREPPKSMGNQFIESEAFKNFQSGANTKASMEFKNTIIGEGGSPQNPTNDIVPLQTMAGIVGGAFRQLRIMDLLNTGTATGNTIHYTRELTFSNSEIGRAHV